MFVRNQFRSSGRDYRRALRQPTSTSLLSIHGSLDPVVPAAAMSAAAPYVGSHRLVSLPGVGHYPHEEEPAAVTAEVVAHLGALGSSGHGR